MDRFYKTRTVREYQNEKESFEANKMGIYYQGKFIDVEQRIDLDRVMEYNAGTANNSGQYTGNPVTHVYLYGSGHSCLLVPFKEFDKAFMDYQRQEESLKSIKK